MDFRNFDKAMEVVRTKINASATKVVPMKKARGVFFRASFPHVSVECFIPDYEMAMLNLNTLPERVIEGLKEKDLKGVIK